MAALPDTSDIKAYASDLAADVAELKEEIKRLSGSIMGFSRAGFDAAQKGGAKQLSAWRDDVDDLATSVTKRGQSQLDVVAGQMRQRPLLTVVAAFGAGFVVSRLIDRR